MARHAIDLKQGRIQKKEPIYGIDLGTTNSLVAHMVDGSPMIIRDHNNQQALLPSVVHWREEGGVLVGHDAQPYLDTHPERTIFSAKRLLGKSYQDLAQQESVAYRIVETDQEESLVKVVIDQKYYTPIEISAEILSALRRRVRTTLGEDMKQVVITVPAYFNDSQRQATRDAGKLAGLDVLRILNEPTAAALAYGIGLKDKESQVIAVYDLGGGTFDVTIMEMTGGVFDVLATHGDTYLGGDDVDKAIVQHWTEELGLLPEKRPQLRALAIQAKKALSTSSDFRQKWEKIDLVLSRETLNRLVSPLIKRTLVSCQQALDDANLTSQDIDKVLLVGGSTRIPMIKSELEEFFGRKPDDSLDPDQAVALGAAIQADILAGNNKDMLLIDVTPLSLGIETMGKLMDVLIPRNTKIPCQYKKQYTTSVDGQVNLKVAVFQGERDSVEDNRKLGEFVLMGIPPMAAGIPKIEIKFLIDADGILQVSARELRSDVEQTVRIRPSYGLSEEDMAQMLIDSIHNASEDMAHRKHQEAVNDCKTQIRATEKFLNQNKTFLNEEELNLLQDLLQRMQTSLNADTDELLSVLDDFNEQTRPIAQRVMDRTIAESLSGQNIADN